MPSGFSTKLGLIRRQLRIWHGLLTAAVLLVSLLLWSLVLDEWPDVMAASAATMIPLLVSLAVVSWDRARADRRFRAVAGPGGRVPSDLSSLVTRLEALDAIVASNTRRPWEPTLIPRSMRQSSGKSILLLPGADYHLPEMMALADQLESAGYSTEIAVGRPHWERTGEGLIWYQRPIHAVPEPEDVGRSYRAVVTMKDWAGYAPLIEAANDAEVPTFAKVEGVQDFFDVDTNQPRRPYQTARHILCQGQNDFDALEGERTIVGSTRLENLWWAPPAQPHLPLAIINLNFTYGVLTAERRLWLDTAVEACELAFIPYVISIHPAERARRPHPRSTSISGSRLLTQATVLISRFSTLPFEAMARGVPFIYHNPHGERVSTYANPEGAFDVTTSASKLAAAIESIGPTGEEYRMRVEAFFRRQVDIDFTHESAERGAAVIVRVMEAVKSEAFDS